MPRLVDPEESEAHHLRRLADLRGARVLEIGCGDGRLTACYAKDAAHVLGIDIKAPDLMAARPIMPTGAQADFMVADARFLPFAAAAFDVVLFARSL